jgi:phenylpropionate dioxygenase-like ring-hydroxylating dioxygenase large terminal subunit
MDAQELLYNFWYVAAPGGHVRRGATRPVILLGQTVLIGRDKEGKAFALRDFCPHRGMPLRYGAFDGCEIECCYHGWRFNTAGVCTHIPSLTPEDKTDVSKIKAMAYPCREIDGNIWVYVPAPGTRPPEALPEIPASPGPAGKRFYWVDSVEFPCHIDHAVIGLMDPSHGPFVHASWWWRTRRSMHRKEKKFAPAGLGFSMVSHKPSANSRAYKILAGGDVATEITFQLPGLRTEHITIGRHHIVLLTALTPIDEKRTQLHQFMYSTMPLLNILRPVLRPFGKAFIRQDLETVRKQQEGLSGQHPSLLLLGDADQQALWYYKLKRDWLASAQQNVPFENRLTEKTLRWYS